MGASREENVREPSKATKAARAPSLPLALALTIAAPLILLLAEHVALPGVDPKAIEETFGPTASVAIVSIGALGVMPFITASYVVEILALLVTRLRPLRHDAPEGRRKLSRAALILALGIALFQAQGVAGLHKAFAEPGLLSTGLVSLTLVAAVALTHLLAEAVSQRGLASGYGLLYAGMPLIWIVEMLGARRAELEAIDVLVTAGAIGALAGATWYALDHGAPRDAPTRAPGAYRTAAGRETHPPLRLPLPASGLVPATLAARLLLMPTNFISSWFGVDLFSRALLSPVVFMASKLALVLGFALLFTRLFNDPSRVAAVFAEARGADASKAALEAEAKAELRSGALKAALFLFTIAAVDAAVRRFVRVPFSAWAVVPTVALLLDIASEIRARRAMPDLVAVWPEHSPYAIQAAREALSAEGIPVHVRGERLRRLLQFFGPYVPLDLMVPAADEERASAILRRTLGARGDRAQGEAKAMAPEVGGARPRPVSALVPAGLALLGALSIGLSIPGRTAPATPTATLELLAVDDEQPIVEADEDRESDTNTLPRGLRREQEQVFLGPATSAHRTFLALVKDDAESMESARTRFEAWLRSRPMPEGTRPALGEFEAYDEERDVVEPVGWRTYLLRGEPILTGANVISAMAMPEPTPGGQGWLVRIEFDASGAAKLEAFTEANVKRRLAIVVDGIVMSAPVIQTKIPGGIVTITVGSSSGYQQRIDAQKLARALGGE